jgi:tRNA(fMet)-specific endonuclease VapC
LRGLRHRNANRKSFTFQKLIERNNVVPLTVRTIVIAADIYAETRHSGSPVDDIDILIASTAIEHDWVLVTHNRKHFEKIAGLEIEDWAEA